MPRERQVYLLDPKQLGPETIAVTFAKTSRSPQSFREIASELTDEKSAQFNERWVVGYGHSSVAEHAVLHLAVENISRLAVECLQSNRLASYTEKSTRYQRWNTADYFLPPEFQHTSLEKIFLEIVQELFLIYQQTTDKLCDHIKQTNEKPADLSSAVYENQVRTKAIDCSRFLLPAAALANVGMTVNARELEHAICKLLSHPLREIQSVGEEIKKIAQESIPTLVKYAHSIPSMSDSCQDLPAVQPEKTNSRQERASCTMIEADPGGEDRVLAAILYRYGSMSFEKCLEFVQQSSKIEKQKIADRVMHNLVEHDQPIRELEYAGFTFDIVLDQGACYELKRHRMMTQTVQQLSTRLGYATPKLIQESGQEKEYRDVMENASEVYEELAEFNPAAASYVVPNGFYRRVLIQLNMREAFTFLSLRSAPNAHFSLRLLAHQMADRMDDSIPHFNPYMRLEQTESTDSIVQNYFV